MELSNAEVREFAKKLAKVNTIVWDAICMCEDLVLSKEFKYFNNNLNHDEKLKELAQAFLIVSENDEGFAQPGASYSYFQDFQSLGNELSKFTGKVERRCK